MDETLVITGHVCLIQTQKRWLKDQSRVPSMIGNNLRPRKVDEVGCTMLNLFLLACL